MLFTRHYLSLLFPIFPFLLSASVCFIIPYVCFSLMTNCSILCFCFACYFVWSKCSYYFSFVFFNWIFPPLNVSSIIFTFISHVREKYFKTFFKVFSNPNNILLDEDGPKTCRTVENPEGGERALLVKCLPDAQAWGPKIDPPTST